MTLESASQIKILQAVWAVYCAQYKCVSVCIWVKKEEIGYIFFGLYGMVSEMLK